MLMTNIIANTYVSMYRRLKEDLAHEFFLTSPAVPCMSFYGCFVRWEVTGCTIAVLLGAA